MGAYFLAFSIVMLMAVIAQLGAGHTVVRFIAETGGANDPGRSRSTIMKCVLLTGAGGALVGAVWAGPVGSWVARDIIGSLPLLGVIGVMALWTFLYAGQSLAAEVFRGFHDIRSSVLFGGVATSGFTLVALGVAWLLRPTIGLDTALTIIVISIAVNLLIAAFYLARRVGRAIPPRNPLGLSRIMSVAWPIWITTTVIQINRQADIWVLGAYAPEDQVAVYGGAARLAEVVSLSLLIINSVVPPIIAEAYSRGRSKDLGFALQATAAVAALPAFAAVALFLLLGPAVLRLAYGDFYAQGSTILLVLALGHLGNALSGSGGLVLLMTGHQLIMMLITVASASLLVMGTVAIAGTHGVLGVAVVAASVNILQNAMYLISARMRTGIWTIANPGSLLTLARNWRQAHLF